MRAKFVNESIKSFFSDWMKSPTDDVAEEWAKQYIEVQNSKKRYNDPYLLYDIINKKVNEFFENKEIKNKRFLKNLPQLRENITQNILNTIWQHYDYPPTKEQLNLEINYKLNQY